MNRPLAATGPQSGFGLLEAVIGIVLLAIVGTTTFNFLRTQHQAANLGTDLSKSMFLGKRKLDSLRTIQFGSVLSGSDTVGSRFIRRWFVTADLVKDRKTVELLVSWPLSAQHTITFNSVIGDDQYEVY